jgi:hypothetical protein
MVTEVNEILRKNLIALIDSELKVRGTDSKLQDLLEKAYYSVSNEMLVETHISFRRHTCSL